MQDESHISWTIGAGWLHGTTAAHRLGFAGLLKDTGKQ
jgi:hypothetical protein